MIQPPPFCNTAAHSVPETCWATADPYTLPLKPIGIDGEWHSVSCITPLAEIKRAHQLINGSQRIVLRLLSELGIALGGFGTGVS